MDDRILQELAIIVLNYKDYNMTIDCVNNLKGLNINSKIVVVDNNSPNDSFEILSNELAGLDNVFIISSEKNGGYSYGNNEGIKFAMRKFSNIRYIGIMNPDVFLNTKDMLLKICTKLEKYDDIAGITGVTLLNGKLSFGNLGWRVNNVRSLVLSNFSLLSKVLRTSRSYKALEMKHDDYELGYTDVMPGSFFIMKENIFKELNYLDEAVFLYFEEEILARKIKSRGLKSAIVISESYVHKHGGKDTELANISKKRLDYKIYMKSQTYYVKNFVSGNSLSMLTLKLSQYIHYYLEIPLICLMYKFKGMLKR